MGSEAAAALIGAGVGGFFAVLGTLLTQLWGDKWRRADQKAKLADDIRERRLAHYSNALYYTYKLGVSAAEKGVKDKDVRQHASEVQRHLVLLAGVAPSESRGVMQAAATVDAAVAGEEPLPTSSPAPKTASAAKTVHGYLRSSANAFL